MKQQHHPKDDKTYEKGINSDSNKEILGSIADGSHLDALNMRSMPMDGDNLAKKKIKGEELVYDLVDNRCNPTPPITLSSDYECMMAQEVNSHIVEIWASPNIGEYPFMRIDGKIVLYSVDFPIDIDHPLQYDKNENCVSGEFYVTNNNTPPMVFSVKDLMSHSGMLDDGQDCDCKYFECFDIEQVAIPVTSILYKPAFIKQDLITSANTYDVVVGTAGLAVGSYSYSYRLVTADGDRTPFSPITELIPVTRSASSNFGPQYPYSKTYSSEPDILSSTSYGNHVRIRYQNEGSFSFLELRRDSWYAGEPLGNPPVSEIISSSSINTGMGIVDIFDKAEALFEGAEILDILEQTDVYSSIKRAKTLRYYNERLYLMNIGYHSKDIKGSVTFIDEADPVFPTIENMGKPGHKHAYNVAMYKSNMRGERTGFGVVLFDNNNNASYATEIANATNFEFPNRRVEVSTDTKGTSYKGLVRAANTGGVVSLTHEVFDHYTASTKEGQAAIDTPKMYNYHEGESYEALNPTSQSDTDSDLHRANIDFVSVTSSPADNSSYTPKIFGLDYYSQGIALKGLSLDAESSKWADGFSVVQTEPARRVIAQGLGFYDLTAADSGFGSDASKGTNSFASYFPDLELLYPDVFEDLINNPTNYSIQCVSPLGYASEIYTTYKEELSDRRKGVDMIVYARILRDSSNIFNAINPVIGASSGIKDNISVDPLQENRYVAYGRYTNDTSLDSPAFPSNAQGNKIFPLTNATSITTNSTRQTYIKVVTNNAIPGINMIYNQTGPNGASNANMNADQPGVKEWREPFYVINLVKDIDINPGLTTQYKYTGNYVKFKSLVLESTGSNSQSAQLVSERWEDCIPSITGQVYNDYTGVKRFVHVVDANGNEQKWMNISFESPASVTSILNSLLSNGFANVIDVPSGLVNTIYGVYRSQESDGDVAGICRVFTLLFNEIPGYAQYSVPALGSKVYVRYDNRIPVRVFGGDTFINESIWAVQDNEYKNNGDPKDAANQFNLNIPFPMKSYSFTANYDLWENSDPWNTENYDFQFCTSVKTLGAYIRQLTTMWTAETRINLSFGFNNESPEKANSDQYFPLINYIPRPHKWNAGNEDDRTVFEGNNHLLTNYYDDYGFEWRLWPYGGIRFTPQVNLDYSKAQTTNIYTTTPTVGFDEQTDFCTRILWSQRRPINIQNTPTVKTFPPANYYDISDDTGEIKLGWSALSGDKGNNLYAFTDSGICLLLIDKRIIHEINANELATVGSDVGGILNQLWIDKTIGMNDETWRSFAEYSNAIFFVNKSSSYSFSDNQLGEIARSGYFELLSRKFLSKIGDGYEAKLSGGFDVLHKEYIANVVNANGDDFSTLIYGLQQGALQCQSSYNYDKYLYEGNDLYGMKNGKTYQLGFGNQIDGVDMECYLSGVSDKEVIYDKEFIRIRVNSNSKPEKIYFYSSFNDYKNDNYSSVVDANANPIHIKDYYGYECYVPRKIVAPHYREQGRVMIFKITNSSNEEFLITSTSVQYKTLK